MKTCTELLTIYHKRLVHSHNSNLIFDIIQNKMIELDNELYFSLPVYYDLNFFKFNFGYNLLININTNFNESMIKNIYPIVQKQKIIHNDIFEFVKNINELYFLDLYFYTNVNTITNNFKFSKDNIIVHSFDNSIPIDNIINHKYYFYDLFFKDISNQLKLNIYNNLHNNIERVNIINKIQTIDYSDFTKSLLDFVLSNVLVQHYVYDGVNSEFFENGFKLKFNQFIINNYDENLDFYFLKDGISVFENDLFELLHTKYENLMYTLNLNDLNIDDIYEHNKEEIYKYYMAELFKYKNDLISIIGISHNFKSNACNFVNSYLIGIIKLLELIQENELSVTITDTYNYQQIYNSIECGSLDPSVINILKNDLLNSKCFEVGELISFSKIVENFINSEEFNDFIFNILIDKIILYIKNINQYYKFEIYDVVNKVKWYFKYKLVEYIVNDLKLSDIFKLNVNNINWSNFELLDDYVFSVNIIDYVNYMTKYKIHNGVMLYIESYLEKYKIY